MKNLSHKLYFDYNNDELLGVMRIDFANDALANQWNPKDLTKKLTETDLSKLQQELNLIQFELINNYEKVIELCGGTGLKHETNLYIDFEIAKYIVKLIPIQDSYSFIYTYSNKQF